MRKPVTLCSLTSSVSSQKKGSMNRKKLKPKSGVSPSEYVLRNIFNYSRALVVFHLPDAAPVSMLMN